VTSTSSTTTKPIAPASNTSTFRSNTTTSKPVSQPPTKRATDWGMCQAVLSIELRDCIGYCMEIRNSAQICKRSV
jgi:hypothetical protein